MTSRHGMWFNFRWCWCDHTVVKNRLFCKHGREAETFYDGMYLISDDEYLYADAGD